MKTCQHPDGCDRPVKARGWCRAHNDRIKATGHPGPAAIRPVLPTGRPCKLPDCDRPVTADAALGYCSMHYQRAAKHGDPYVVHRGGASLPLDRNPNWSGAEATYPAVHLRLARHQGRAADHACVDCGLAAAHWSYDHTDRNEKRSPEGLLYSVNPDHYSPRCVPCHSALDHALTPRHMEIA